MYVFTENYRLDNLPQKFHTLHPKQYKHVANDVTVIDKQAKKLAKENLFERIDSVTGDLSQDRYSDDSVEPVAQALKRVKMTQIYPKMLESPYQKIVHEPRAILKNTQQLQQLQHAIKPTTLYPFNLIIGNELPGLNTMKYRSSVSHKGILDILRRGIKQSKK